MDSFARTRATSANMQLDNGRKLFLALVLIAGNSLFWIPRERDDLQKWPVDGLDGLAMKLRSSGNKLGQLETTGSTFGPHLDERFIH